MEFPKRLLKANKLYIVQKSAKNSSELYFQFSLLNWLDRYSYFLFTYRKVFFLKSEYYVV